MRPLFAAAAALVATLLVVTPTSAASATSWRATITGTTMHGGATTLITSDGHGSISVSLTGIRAGEKAAVLVNPTTCPTQAQDLFSFELPAASSAGAASGRHVLTADEVTAYNQALSRRTKLSILVVTSNDVGCGDQAGAPSVGTARIQGTVASVGASYDIRYPVVGGIAAAAATSINGVLKSDAQATVAGFIHDAVQQGKPDPGIEASDVAQAFSVSLATPALLSLGELAGYYYTGAAHGGAVLSTYTFDLATGHEYQLAELFRPGTPWLQLLSTQSRAMLKAQFNDPSLTDFFVNPGTTPSMRNFQGWQLVPSGLKITFGEYQVAPYAMGMPAIVIPWSTLRPLMNLRTPIATLTPQGPCLASQLSATMSDWQAGAGQRYNLVHLRNVSAVSCWLQGAPGARLVDRTGRVLLTSGVTPAVHPTGPRVVVAPGASASIAVWATNYCGKPPADPTHLVFALPGLGGSVSAAPSAGGSTGDDLPPCFGPGVAGYLTTEGWHHA